MSPLRSVGRWAATGIWGIKDGRGGQTPSLHAMGRRHPSHIPPELWKEYLRRYPRWAWWIGDTSGNHPDYPGMLPSSQHDSPTPSKSPSPCQSGSPSSSTSRWPDHRSPLWALLASPSLSAVPPSLAQPDFCADRPGATQSVGVPPRGMYGWQCCFMICWLTPHHPVAPVSGNQDHPQMVTISVPLNTTIVGGLVTRRELRIPSNLIFADFYSRMCVNMDLDPNEASIGYKFHTDRAKDVPRQLSNELEYLAMMQEMIRKVLAAQTRNPVLFLHNLVCPCLLVQNVVCSQSRGPY